MQINVLNVRAELSQNNSIKCLRMLQIWYKKNLRLFSSQSFLKGYKAGRHLYAVDIDVDDTKFLERIKSREALICC